MRTTRAITATIPATLATLAVAAPLLWHSHALAAWGVTLFFSFACHQDPTRSFWIAGAPVAVCARCLGIYLGAAAGAWFRIAHRSALLAFAVTAAVNLLDVASEAAGLHGNWPRLRVTLGLSLGAAIGALVANALPRRVAISNL